MVFQDTPKIVYRTILANHNSHVTSQQTFAGLQNVLKTSSRHVLKTSTTCLQCNNFSSCKDVVKTSWKRLEDISENVLKTPWRRLGRRKIVTQITSWRHVLNTSWRNVLKTCLEEVLKTCLEDVLETNKSKCVYLWSNKSTFNKSISDKSKANPKCID